MTIHLAKFGKILATRHLAETVVWLAREAFHSDQSVTLDFSGVDFISQSFADELLRHFIDRETVCRDITWTNTNLTAERVLRHVIASRLRKSPADLSHLNFITPEESDEPVVLS